MLRRYDTSSFKAGFDSVGVKIVDVCFCSYLRLNLNKQSTYTYTYYIFYNVYSSLFRIIIKTFYTNFRYKK